MLGKRRRKFKSKNMISGLRTALKVGIPTLCLCGLVWAAKPSREFISEAVADTTNMFDLYYLRDRVEYTVKKGDTLFNIWKTDYSGDEWDNFKGSVERFNYLNPEYRGEFNPDNIEYGKSLRLPMSKTY